MSGCFIDFSDEVGAALFNSLDNRGAPISLISGSSLGFSLFLFPLIHCHCSRSSGSVAPLVRAMRSESRNPIQDGKDGEVFLEDRVQLRAVDNSLTLSLVSDFLHRERRIYWAELPAPACPSFR